MAHKIFFMSVFLFVLASVGGMLLYKLNFLPPSVYSFVYDFQFGSSEATRPYLEKFEGPWRVTFSPNGIGSDVNLCPIAEGNFTIHDGELTGSLGDTNHFVTVDATVDVNGTLQGQAMRGSQVTGQVTGTLGLGKGTGELTDAAGCTGDITLLKLGAVDDPVQATLVSFNGGVQLLRGETESGLMPGELLYAGDVLDIPDGGDVYLSLGKEKKPVTVEGKAEYTITESN